MVKKFVFDFGEVDIYENYAVGVINEGEVFKRDQVLTLYQYSLEAFGKKPFGYISNRLNSYSLDPRIYSVTKMAPNLVAIAIVVKSPAQKMSAAVEKMFFDKPFKYFESFEKAKAWMDHQIANHTASFQSA
ncbi:hypothetical protein SAMN04487906_1795 [Zhouia amylolytica]|uniref:SpoIIAA-like n=1 Tax=Zhouia amylolytica TaxID=376730 RepID=A0A1I6T2D6_9FLAO|nr:hypothetical protein [Zhouia amylolytica]MCQ0112679.1 hypothetical protein [Zhouia amylolytica]SFS83283.1 hypothetical protein SAMN04487906_1795 [Zhouia amylolytica]